MLHAHIVARYINGRLGTKDLRQSGQARDLPHMLGLNFPGFLGLVVPSEFAPVA